MLEDFFKLLGEGVNQHWFTKLVLALSGLVWFAGIFYQPLPAMFNISSLLWFVGGLIVLFIELIGLAVVGAILANS
ncbi:MAG: hypothetical protein IAE80_00575 [Anaerolinea sp.]|nr:hypothetical protein [Anaerolinea sp.]